MKASQPGGPVSQSEGGLRVCPCRQWVPCLCGLTVPLDVLDTYASMCVCMHMCAGESNVNGFGLEFYIETPAEEVGSSLSDIKKSWQFQLLYTVSQLAAGAR